MQTFQLHAHATYERTVLNKTLSTSRNLTLSLKFFNDSFARVLCLFLPNALLLHRHRSAEFIKAYHEMYFAREEADKKEIESETRYNGISFSAS